jgi:antitoxin CcdA
MRTIIHTLNTAGADVMQTNYTSSGKKGRLSLSINQELLDRFEPYKQQVNFSAQAELMLARMLEALENRHWAERNAEALAAHGADIARTGLAGADFERI